MSDYSGKKHIVSALMRRYTNRIPVTILIGPYCSQLTNYSLKEILLDAKKSAEAHIAFYERFKPDSLIVYNDIYLEAEAIGCELEFPEDAISHPKGPILENKASLAMLKVPDPQKDGRIPYFIEVCQRVSSHIGKSAALGLGHSGPWNIAMHLRGAEALLMDTVMDPEFVHDLMRFSTEVVREMGMALIQAGFSPSLGEAAASCSLISPKIYQDFIKPCHQELCEHFKSLGSLLSLHICGKIDPIMEDVLDTGIRLISLDAPSSLKKLREISAEKVVAMGNVPTVLFSSGTQAEMETAIRDCIDTAAENSGYFLASGCEIPLNSTEDRIEHYFNYGRQYGHEYISKLQDRKPELFQEK